MHLLALNRLPTDLHSAIALRELAVGQILFRQGDSASAFFIVESGRLKVARYAPEGRSVTLQIARSGDSFAESALFSDFYVYTAIAEVASRVIVYPKQPLLTALREHSNLAEDFMTRLVSKNLFLIMQLELRDVRAAHRRVLQYLHYLASPDDANIVSFDRPLKEIAIDLGLTPATLSRALARLEREGRITREQNVVKLNSSAA